MVDTETSAEGTPTPVHGAGARGGLAGSFRPLPRGYTTPECRTAVQWPELHSWCHAPGYRDRVLGFVKVPCRCACHQIPGEGGGGQDAATAATPPVPGWPEPPVAGATPTDSSAHADTPAPAERRPTS